MADLVFFEPLPGPLLKKKLGQHFFALIYHKILSQFYSAGHEVIGAQVPHRQSGKFFDNTYLGMCFFISVQFATAILALLAGE